MSNSLREALLKGCLPNEDVQEIIDWQLSLKPEAVDRDLLVECLLHIHQGNRELSLEEELRLSQKYRADVNKYLRWRAMSEQIVMLLRLLLLVGMALVSLSVILVFVFVLYHYRVEIMQWLAA